MGAGRTRKAGAVTAHSVHVTPGGCVINAKLRIQEAVLQAFFYASFYSRVISAGSSSSCCGFLRSLRTFEFQFVLKYMFKGAPYERVITFNYSPNTSQVPRAA